MLKIEKVVLPSAEQWEAIIRGMRNPKNSWDLSDSYEKCIHAPCSECRKEPDNVADCEYFGSSEYEIGPNDHKLMTSLANGGPVHAKYRRMIPVFLDITAPLYWWKEFDTYKIGTVTNSCSTMHKIQAKEFTLEDFSHEHLEPIDSETGVGQNDFEFCLDNTIDYLNVARNGFNNASRKLKRSDLTQAERKHVIRQQKRFWWQMIQLLPSSYNQKRTVMLNYEVLHNIYISRKNHKLDEWHVFCDWIESLPYSELITGRDKEMEAKALERYKTIYEKIKNHGLPEWKEFTSWVEAALETKEKES